MALRADRPPERGSSRGRNYLDSQPHMKSERERQRQRQRDRDRETEKEREREREKERERERVCVCWVLSHLNGTENIFFFFGHDF